MRKIFVASKHNNFFPHLLRETGAFFTIAIFIGLLFGTTLIKDFITDKTNLLSEVYPAIITSLTNQGRNENNIPTLKYNLVLEKAARNKVNDMIAHSYFAHYGPGGKKPWDWIREAGYQYEYAGENLAINYSDSVDVYNAWMNSPGHKANILNNNYTEIGVATAKTKINGKESVLVVQMFGQPKSGIATIYEPDVVVEPEIEENNQSDILLGGVANENVIVSFDVGENIGSPQNPDVLADLDSNNESVLAAINEKDEGLKSDHLRNDEISSNLVSSDQESKNIPEGYIIADVNSVNTNAQETEKTLNISPVKKISYEIATSPRYIVLILYVLFIVVINIALISLGMSGYRRDHKKAIFIAVLLVFCLSLISIAYIYLNLPSVTI